MENVAILGGIVIKYGILLICLIGIVRIFLLRNDTTPHYLTMVVTVIFTLLTIYLFAGDYLNTKEDREEISGDYKLTWYKCEKCPDCVVTLRSDGTYILLNNGLQIDQGDWNCSRQLLTLFIDIENGSSQEKFNEERTLSYIKNDNCQLYWRNQNLRASFEGEIIEIDKTKGAYGVPAIRVNDIITQKPLIYEPSYLGHPWLIDVISVGDSITKVENSMKFTIKKLDGTILEVDE